MYVPLVKVSMVREKELPYTVNELDRPEKVAVFMQESLAGADLCNAVPVAMDLIVAVVLGVLLMRKNGIVEKLAAAVVIFLIIRMLV